MDWSSADPPPLTSKRRTGEPYVRRPEVVEAIRAALARPATEWAALIDSGAGGPMPPEAIVFLARRAAHDGKRDIFGALIWVLAARVARSAKKRAGGFDRETVDEIVEAVERRIVDRVLQDPPSRQSEFLEVTFDLAVKRQTINAIEKRVEAPVSLTIGQCAADDEDSVPASELVADDAPGPAELIDETHDPVRRHKLFESARKVVKNPRHYEAFVLFYKHGWPLSSEDPSKPTLAKRFGRTERQIRNWIRAAEKAIRTSLGDTPP